MSLDCIIKRNELLFLNDIAFAKAKAGDNGIPFIVMDLDIEGMELLHVAMTMEEFNRFLSAANRAARALDN